MKTGSTIQRSFLWEYSFLFPILFWFIYAIVPLPAFQFSDGLWLWLPRLGFAVQETLNGSIPFWNEFQFCGTPLLADGSTNILNPVTLLYFFLSPPWAYTISIIIPFFFLILGTWKYFRIRGFSLVASMIGTLGFVFGGQILFWSLYHGMNLSFALFPWICIAFRKLETNRRLHWQFLAFVLVFLNLLGGFIQFALFIVVTVFIEGIDRFSYAQITKVIRSRLLMLFLGVFSASVIIMPTIETAVFSHRKFVPYFKELFPDRLSFLLMTLWGHSNGSHDYPNYFYFVGVILLALAFWGVRANFVEVISYPFFLFSLIPPLILLVVYFKILPIGFQFGVQSDPFRGMFIFIFALSLLAARGTESYLCLLRGQRSKKQSFPPFELLIGALIIFFVSFKFDASTFVSFKRLCLFTGGMIIAGFLFPLLVKTIRVTARVQVWISALWLIILMMLNSFIPAQIYLKKNVTHDSRTIINRWEEKGVDISTLATEGRVLHVGSNHPLKGLFEDCGIYFGIRSIGGYGTFFPQSIFMRMRDDGILPSVFDAVSHFRNNRVIDTEVLAKYGVVYLIDEEGTNSFADNGWQLVETGTDISVYRNPKFVGRAYIIDQKKNILKGAPIIANTNSYVKVSVDTEAGDVLILADSWFPGWTCYDNGERVQGFDANGFRGYRVITSGHHEIEWIYQPLSFLIGLIASVFSVILFLLVTFWGKFFKKAVHIYQL